MKCLKKILAWLFYVISVIADLLTIVGVDNIWKYVPENHPVWLPIALWIIVAVTFVYAVGFTISILLRQTCRTNGTHNIPCSLQALYYAKKFDKTLKSLRAMHGIYHAMCSTKQKIKNHRDQYNSVDAIKPLVNEFLDIARGNIQMLLHISLRVSVKKAVIINSQHVLRTYTYVTDIINGNGMERRYKDYLISVGAEELGINDMSAWCESSRNYATGHGNAQYFSNSMFNYMIGKRHMCWMSNDLSVDEKNNVFHTSSSYRCQYNSLAILLITAPKENVDDTPHRIEGILTFDSDKTNLFVEKECRQIMGYVAHCLYEIFNEIDNEIQ